MVVDANSDRARIRIAVCGERNAGKTVFQTCLLKTLHLALPHEYVVDFDRHQDDGNALYFDDIESVLAQTGKIEPTAVDAIHPVSILLTPDPRRLPPGPPPPPLAIDLMDFSGENFRALGAVAAALEKDQENPRARETLRKVQAFVEGADAFVMLANAADLTVASPGQASMTASMRRVIARCRDKRTPIALVLPQSDRLPKRAVDGWLTSPSVTAFRRDFSDRAGAFDRADGPPFGLVEALTCYELMAESLEPVSQSADGSIWMPDAAKVFARLIKEATPFAVERARHIQNGHPTADGDGAPRAVIVRTPAADIKLRESYKFVIAVCGEQGAGKTVFLTCLFRTFERMFGADVLARFIRESSHATHFLAIENDLIATGGTDGTTVSAQHSMTLTVAPLTEPDCTLSIELRDYAGGIFHHLSDRDHQTEENEGDEEAEDVSKQVREFVKSADAFVVLVNTREVDPRAVARERDAFSASVDWVQKEALAERKPMALLFSQADRVPAVTDASIHGFERVQLFEAQRTDSLAELEGGTKTYGIVRRIACYERGPDGVRPRRQTSDGSIWKTEPAEAVVSLVRALVTNHRRKVREEEIRIQEEEDKRLQEEQRKVLVAAALGGTILVVIMFVFIYAMTAAQ